jgi:hypothetical protein
MLKMLLNRSFKIVMRCHAINLNAIWTTSNVGINMSRPKKRQVCFRIEESIVQEMEQIREKTGVPVSTQIELRLKGFAINSVPEKGNPDEIWRLFSNLEKDEELANNIDIAVNRMRQGLKLH